MRILHAILGAGFFGSERYCIELAAVQAQAGHDVTVIAYDADSDCSRSFEHCIDESRRISATFKTPRLRVIPRAVPSWLHRPLVRRWLRQGKPDIVHSHLNPAARRVGRVAEALGIAHVATLHLNYERREHHRCDGLIALTRTQAAQTASVFPGPVEVVWNWLSPSISDALEQTRASDVADLRRQWSTADTSIVFGSVGRLEPSKGMDLLVRAFQAAFPNDAAVRLVIVGAGPQRDALARLIAVDSRIRLVGHRSDMAPHYRAFDMFVSAARSEPFGLAIIEAMAARCPLILARNSGPAEFATDPRIRWFAVDDDDALAAHLRDACAHGRLRLTYDLTPFSIARAAGEIETFYRTVLERHPARGPA